MVRWRFYYEGGLNLIKRGFRPTYTPCLDGECQDLLKQYEDSGDPDIASSDPSPTREGDTYSLGAFGASILVLGVPVPFHLRLEHCHFCTVADVYVAMVTADELLLPVFVSMFVTVTLWK